MRAVNKRIVFTSLLLFLLAQNIPFASAQKPITAWTDKPTYSPGDSGTLYIAFYNTEDTAVTVNKTVIIFENWIAFKDGKWEGNVTIEVNKALTSKEVYFTKIDFKVPTDGRAVDTPVQIAVYTNEAGIIAPPAPEFLIHVSETPPYMTQILNLFTIHVVLMIVCTIIIAATIFLSTRRPRAIWVEEEQKEKSE